jgi:integrase/recombinase XerD
MALIDTKVQKSSIDMMDKILDAHWVPKSDDSSLLFWMGRYFNEEVFGGKDKTVLAKKKDIKAFLSFFFDNIGMDNVDAWTVSVSKSFLKELQSKPSDLTGKLLKPSTINRTLASIKHWSRWIERYRPFLSGSPMKDVKELVQDEPAWNGLTDRQLMLLKMACDHRLAICTKKIQNPVLEVSVFYMLLHTGLREFELCGLTVGQYYDKGLHNIKRKGRMITQKVFLPTEAREKLDAYLTTRGETTSEDPLFVSRFGNSLKELDVYRICERISNQASAQLPKEEGFKLRPHQLRHTFLKRVADKHGLNYAKKVSGNVGIREIYRYTAPSQGEVEDIIEGLYE